MSVPVCVGVCVPEKEGGQKRKNSTAVWVKGGRCSRACSDMSHRICHIRGEGTRSLWCPDPAAGWCCLAVATHNSRRLQDCRSCSSLTLCNPAGNLWSLAAAFCSSRIYWTLACTMGRQDIVLNECTKTSKLAPLPLKSAIILSWLLSECNAVWRRFSTDTHWNAAGWEPQEVINLWKEVIAVWLQMNHLLSLLGT